MKTTNDLEYAFTAPSWQTVTGPPPDHGHSTHEYILQSKGCANFALIGQLYDPSLEFWVTWFVYLLKVAVLYNYGLVLFEAIRKSRYLLHNQIVLFRWLS